MILLKLWIAYAIWGTGVYSAVFIWAVRNRQFSEPDRQRRMALDTEDPIEIPGTPNNIPNRLDRYTWVFLLLMTLAMVVAALWLSLKNG